MQKLSKKAVSGIVATVVIMLIGIAAVAIVAVSIKSVVNEDVLLSPAKCLEMQTSPPLEITSACLNSETGRVELNVKRSRKELEISQIDFRIAEDTWSCGPTCGNCNIPIPGNSQNYFFEPSILEQADSLEISVSSCLLGKKDIKPC
tara:strand:- start:50 stop:490 length:441 start_codon:yes stop_codon:yes gene_type:complete